MSVDFPDPERPMTTKVSPLATSKLTSMTAAVPREARSSRDSPALSLSITSRSCLPKTLYRWDARTKSTSYGNLSHGRWSQKGGQLEVTHADHEGTTISRHGAAGRKKSRQAQSKVPFEGIMMYLHLQPEGIVADLNQFRRILRNCSASAAQVPNGTKPCGTPHLPMAAGLHPDGPKRTCVRAVRPARRSRGSAPFSRHLVGREPASLRFRRSSQ